MKNTRDVDFKTNGEDWIYLTVLQKMVDMSLPLMFLYSEVQRNRKIGNTNSS